MIQPIPITQSLSLCVLLPLAFANVAGQNNNPDVKSKAPFVNDTRLQSTKDEKPVWHLPEQAAGFVLAVGAFTTLGPFGTFDMTFLLRLLYWTLSLGAGWVFTSTAIFILRHFGFLHAEARLANIAICLIIAALPTALVVLVLEAVLRPSEQPFLRFDIMLYVLVVVFLVGGAVLLYVKGRLPKVTRLPQHLVFFKRLPPQLGTELISLSSQDHYVEVTTEKGRELIHMRLSDALEELRDYSGQQIHRSHWIAARAFRGTSRENNRLVVHLSDGRSLPVSRSFASDVRAMLPHVKSDPQ